MQRAHCELIEIIWEITDNCGQNCSYCGSKDILNQTPIDNERIKKIGDRIANYPPKEIDISGGNPLLVDYGTHKYLVNKFKAKNIKCKILFNPFNLTTGVLKDTLASYNDIRVIDLYDWVGISINTKKELERLKELNLKCVNKTTVITNFNVSNVFLFKEIENFVLLNNISWQIQYTMYKGDDENALYKNVEANSYLLSMVDVSAAKIIKADNMNNGQCTAGKHSIGILANGDVMPCLSMRSWKDDLLVKGNLITQDLASIWLEGFAIFRCNGFDCCKDVVNNTLEGTTQVEIISLPKIEKKPTVPFEHPNKSKPYNPNMTFLYGVRPFKDDYDYQPGMVMAYAVQQEPISVMYAVQVGTVGQGDWNLTSTQSDGTVYNIGKLSVTATPNGPVYDLRKIDDETEGN